MRDVPVLLLSGTSLLDTSAFQLLSASQSRPNVTYRGPGSLRRVDVFFFFFLRARRYVAISTRFLEGDLRSASDHVFIVHVGVASIAMVAPDVP